MSIHNASSKPGPQRQRPSSKPRQTHNLSENINNSSLTIQQYNNFINIDAFKNNILIETEATSKPKNLPLKTSPSPMKKELSKPKKPNYSTDRYVIDRPQPLVQKNNNKKDYSSLFQKLKGKIALNKQMGRSFENARPQPSTLNSQGSREGLKSAIGKGGKKTVLTNSFAAYNGPSSIIQNNFELMQAVQKIEGMISGFLAKNEASLNSENDVLTVFLTNLLGLLSELGEVDESLAPIFKNLRFAVEVPISRMVEQFLRLRDFLLEQNTKLIENEKEIEYLKGQIAVLMKENDKMSKNQIMMNNFFSDRYEINEFGLSSLQEIIKENNKLRTMLKKQKDSMVETRDKDAKIMKLLYAIRKKGVDIEEIYNEDVKTPEEISFMDENLNIGNNNNNVSKIGLINNNVKKDAFLKTATKNENIEIDVDESARINESNRESGIRNDLYCDNSETSLRKENSDRAGKSSNEKERPQHLSNSSNGKGNNTNINITMNNNNSNVINSNYPGLNLKDQMKINGQLKLNLSPLFNAQKPNPINGKVEIKGFHEEFMARLDEFSQSWRLAAMAEKKF